MISPLPCTCANNVRIKVLVVDPEFPGDIPDYQRKYETWLLEQAKGSGSSPKALRKIEDDDDVPVVSESSDSETEVLEQ